MYIQFSHPDLLDVPIPRFEGIHIEPYQKLSGPGSLEPNNNIISDEDREKYKDMFYKCNPVNGILEGNSWMYKFYDLSDH